MDYYWIRPEEFKQSLALVHFNLKPAEKQIIKEIFWTFITDNQLTNVTQQPITDDQWNEKRLKGTKYDPLTEDTIWKPMSDKDKSKLRAAKRWLKKKWNKI